MIVITPQSHLDHGLDVGHVRFILERFAHETAFTLATVELPPSLADLPCALRGPTVGNVAVPDDEVVLRVRNGRAWPSRMMRMGYALMNKPGHVSWAPMYVRQLTVIMGPAGLGSETVALYTAYAGPVAPREPGDPSLASDHGALAASVAFWAEHALVP